MEEKKIKQILLVDDDTVACYLHQAIIEDAGLAETLHFASNGLEALQFLKDLKEQEGCPGLILLDLNMPVVNGFEFLDFYNHMDFHGKEDTKIIILSSSKRQDEIRRTRELGAADFLIKPLNKEKLRQVLEKHF